ncbi:MAG: LD-carboxypeptidase, partial [Armatimonadota bacterium]
PGAADRHPELDYLAGTDARRADDLNGLLADPGVDLVLCARGGYGAARLLDRIDYAAIRRDPKPLVGYSDITALNLAVLARAGVVSYSGIMATAGDGFGEGTLDPRSAASFWSAVTGGIDAVQTPPDGRAPLVVRAAPNGDTHLRGHLLPVCLTLLESLASTPYAPIPDGALLLVEDVHEPLYAVDRAFTQLRLSGFLDRLAGILVGTFTGGPDGEDLAERVAAMVAAMTSEHVPVVVGVPYGHVPCRHTLPVGASTEFDLSTGTFRFVPG